MHLRIYKELWDYFNYRNYFYTIGDFIFQSVKKSASSILIFKIHPRYVDNIKVHQGRKRFLIVSITRKLVPLNPNESVARKSLGAPFYLFSEIIVSYLLEPLCFSYLFVLVYFVEFLFFKLRHYICFETASLWLWWHSIVDCSQHSSCLPSFWVTKSGEQKQHSFAQLMPMFLLTFMFLFTLHINK